MSIQAQFTSDGIDHDERIAVPGVELVLSTVADTSMLGSQSLRLLGALQRRSWKRQRDLMRRRSSTNISLVADPIAPVSIDNPVLVDLVDIERWDDRLTAVRSAIDAVTDVPSKSNIVVRVRAWDVKEPGVLVDGRVATAAIFDIATMISAAVEQFRRGEQPFVLLIPELEDARVARFWSELIAHGEDRLGIDRGTVRYTTHIQ